MPIKETQPPQALRQAASPLTVSYRNLLAELKEIDAHLESGGDTLQSAAIAVLAVNRFLFQDQFVKASGVGKALRVLADQLGDAYAGSKQTIFIKEIARGQRPSLAVDNQRGMLVFALDVLIKQRMKNAEAAAFLSAMLKDINFKYGGKQVTTKLLLTWREQIGDTSPAAATEMMKRLKATAPIEIATLEDAKTTAQALVQVVARRNSK
jgi:hypothetical protein